MIEFVICIERGYFEEQAKLLIQTIRTLGGSFKDAPIFCYQPRKQFPIKPSTVNFLEKYQVEFSDQYLNRKTRYFKFANKPIVCSHHEMKSNADVIAYFDCDTIVLNDLSPFASLEKGQIIVRPEDSSHFVGCSSQFEGHSGHIWKKIYEQLNIKSREVVYSIENYLPMLAYYNAGQIISNRTDQFFSRWNENFSKCLKDKLFDRSLLVMSDQILMSATVSQMELKVQKMGVNFNFPVNLYLFDEIKHPDFKNVSFNDLITLHYHKILKRGYNPLEYLMRKSENGKQVNEIIESLDLMSSEKGQLKDRVRHKVYARLAKRKFCT